MGAEREDFGGRLRIGPAIRKQKWGPLLKASLLSAQLRRPAEKKEGSDRGSDRVPVIGGLHGSFIYHQ